MVSQTLPHEPPLVEPLRAFDESRALVGIESPDPKLRSESVELLKTFGTERTAQKIENMILQGNPTNMSKRALRDVLLELSNKYRQTLMDPKSWARRRRALTQTVTALPAIRRLRANRIH